MKKRIAILLALVLMLTVFVGCKNEGETPVPPANTTAVKTATADPETGAPTTASHAPETSAEPIETAAPADTTINPPATDGEVAGYYQPDTMNGQSIMEFMMDQMGDSEMTMDQLEEYLDLMDMDLNTLFFLEIREDGTFDLGVMSETVTGEWTQEGPEDLSMTVDGETVHAKFDGVHVALSEDGQEMVFVKGEKPAETKPAVPETTEDLDGPTDPDNIVGSYVLVEMNGQTLEEMIADAAADSGMTADDFLDAMKEVGMDFENLIVLEIHEDGTCKMTSMADDSEEGTWSLDGDQVTITFDGDDATGTFADGKISLSEEDTTMVFAKR